MANWTCHAASNLPLDEETAWDGSAATAAMLDAAKIGGDSPDFEKARRGFLLVDDSAKELRGSYSLPFCTVKSGTLTALISGCRAAANRLPQKDGVSDAERTKARDVLDAYFAKANDGGKQDVEADADDTGRALVFAVRAAITRRYTSADQPAGSVSEPWMDAAKKMAVDPSVFDDHPPFFFRAMASNNRRDAYDTRMHTSTLQNFAADAGSGVSFQNSHRDTELGFGRTVIGEYLGSPGNGSERMETDIYTMPGLNLNGVNTNDLIRGIRGGLVKDVSVGFYGGSMRCGTCKRELFTGDCWHVPGLRYDREGKPTDNPDAPPSIAWVHDARLAEVSAVYDGACPGAAIMKARQLSAAGHLRPDAARLLEARYRITLPASHRAWPSPGLTPAKENAMPELTLDDVRRDLRRALEINDPGIDPVTHALEIAPQLKETATLKAECERLRPLKGENERLTALADVGRQYHTDLLEETLAEGVRAQGNHFALETQRALLANATLDQLKTLKASYSEQAKTTLSGGRVSQDRAEHDPADAAPTNGKNWTPKGAFAG